jgi:hypothetical protein
MTREEQFLQLVQVGLTVHECRKPPRPEGHLPRDLDEITGDFSFDAVLIMSLAQQVVLTGRLPPKTAPFTLARDYLSCVLDKRGIGSASRRAEKPKWLEGIGYLANPIKDEEARKTAIGFLTEAARCKS